MEHVSARQQEILDLVRRTTHQAQLRQTLKYDRTVQARAYQLGGELVWVFCRYVPEKGSPKLMRAWRGPQKVVHVLQDGRVYILNTGQQVHFERLKPHRSRPTEFVTAPLDSGEIVVIMDPNPERSAEPIEDDMSKPNNNFHMPRMCPHHHENGIGWTPGFAQNSVLVDHAYTTNYMISPL